ncbi:hypothetical protein [Parerythrobacter jejuensis]|uniref:Uncharacterized protein n=1 Tax=Parerythrobacter jejuensis TaxID=795812 RepID=A0A845AUS3_9SPHN|nr:hypothetical protein [Parerythrobacter jejuensis]MXP30578.1 hypothetical protein [Parerythrobacter jejuensis]MXP33338.1 hypothetical protein [Parerythrobacter jejuensis]
MSTLSLLAAVAADTAPLATGTGPSIPWGRIILAFVFCILLAVAAIGFIRVKNGMSLIPDTMAARMSASGEVTAPPAGKMQIVQRLSVTPASQLVIVRRGTQNYMLHLTNHGATEIDRFGDDGVSTGEVPTA